MVFTKMQGAGNDYIFIDCTKENVSNPEKISILMSDRHFGVGSDGIILIQPSENADFFMSMYNADGSRGEMCGNGIRCLGKYVYDHKLTDKTTVSVDTLAGIKQLKLHIGEDRKVKKVTVNMGKPHFSMPKYVKIEAYDRTFTATCVDMGNPHAVIFLSERESIEDFCIEEYGPFIENFEAFPNRTNVEFVQVTDRDVIKMRVWERGSGETLACGTGACAALVAAVDRGVSEREATVCLRGGNLKVTWNRKTDYVFMEGSADTVYTGQIELG